MEALRKLIIVTFGLAIAICLSIVNMIYGWGVSPKSWGVIIGVGFFGQVFAQIIMMIGSHKD
jgi:drug/metabolite transporter (DMT)-like permease